MLRTDELQQKFDSLFVPVGTAENSPAIHRREAKDIPPRPSGTLEFPPAKTSSVPLGRGFICSFSRQSTAGLFSNRPYRDENTVKSNVHFPVA